MAGNQAGPWKDALALLEAGFPRSAADLEEQYNILEQHIDNGTGRLVLQPKSASARRMMPQISIEFDLANHSLRATTLYFADRSSLRNDFSNSVLNPPTDPQLFSPEIPKDYKVVEPLTK
jgi:outer membrane lipoprotein-sorting protein